MRYLDAIYANARQLMLIIIFVMLLMLIQLLFTFSMRAYAVMPGVLRDIKRAQARWAHADALDWCAPFW